MMKKISFLITLFIVLGFNSHKYYVSTSLFDFKEDSDSLQITLKIFKDDFIKLISNKYEINLENKVHKGSRKAKSKISEYLLSNLIIHFDDIKQELIYLGYEENNEMFTFYLELENISSFNFIKLQNTILFELFDKQQNVIHLKKNNKKRSFITRKDSFISSFEF